MFARRIACCIGEKMKIWRFANIAENIDGKKKLLMLKGMYQQRSCNTFP